MSTVHHVGFTKFCNFHENFIVLVNSTSTCKM